MPDYHAAEPYVFLSYASVDRERALALADWLETTRVPVWIDRTSHADGAARRHRVRVMRRPLEVGEVMQQCERASISPVAACMRLQWARSLHPPEIDTDRPVRVR